MPDQTFTRVDIENLTGIHRKKVGNALWHYKKAGIPYFRKLRKKAPNGLIRWKVTKSGEQAWWAYLMRIKRGFDLNRCSNKIKRMPTHGKFEFEKPKTPEDITISSIPQERLADYLGLTKYGVEVMELTQEDLLRIVAGMTYQQ
jgi:hypothetical protein